MVEPLSPQPIDETVAFDDLLVNRWYRSPCVLCHTPRPGYYVLWMEHASGFVAMFPLCETCQRRPDKPLQLAYAMQHRLHPEEAIALATGPATDATAESSRCHPPHSTSAQT